MRWALIILMLWLCVLGAVSDPGKLGNLGDVVNLEDVDEFDELDETGELFEAEDSDEIDDLDETVETEGTDGFSGLDTLGTLGGFNRVGGAFNQAAVGCHSEKNRLMDSPVGGCHACSLYSEMRQMSLAVIREQVLAKLGFTHAPNTTGRELPQVPKAILLQYERESAYEREMQSDQPLRYSYHEDEDDFQAKMEKIIAMPHHTVFGKNLRRFVRRHRLKAQFPAPKRRRWRDMKLRMLEERANIYSDKIDAKIMKILNKTRLVKNRAVS